MRTRMISGSCRRATRCHTYDAVGYGTVGTVVTESGHGSDGHPGITLTTLDPTGDAP